MPRVLELGSHHELIQMENEAGAYLRMVQLQQIAQKEAPESFDRPLIARSDHKIKSSTSPYTSRSRSWQGSPVMEKIHIDNEAFFDFEMQPHVDGDGKKIEKFNLACSKSMAFGANECS